MYEQFKARAEAVRAEVHRFSSRKEAFAFVVGIFQEQGVADKPGRYAVCAPCPCMDSDDRGGLAALPGVCFEVTRDRAAGALIGLSQMEWGLADTGTMVRNATAVDERLVSSLPLIHIALLATASIVPDMPAWLERTNPATLGGYTSMITGPSRTADIERVLTIGVHGPARVIICCIDELEGGTN